LSSLDKLIAKCEKNNTELILTDIPKQPLSTLAHANIKPIKGVLRFYLTLGEARKVVVQELQAERDQYN
jgi:SulP family sulfate permease